MGRFVCNGNVSSIWDLGIGHIGLNTQTDICLCGLLRCWGLWIFSAITFSFAGTLLGLVNISHVRSLPNWWREHSIWHAWVTISTARFAWSLYRNFASRCVCWDLLTSLLVPVVSMLMISQPIIFNEKTRWTWTYVGLVFPFETSTPALLQQFPSRLQFLRGSFVLW